MYGILIYLRWGGLRGQCRHIWHAWSVWDIVMNSAMLITVSTVSLPRNTYSSILKFVNTHTHTLGFGSKLPGALPEKAPRQDGRRKSTPEMEMHVPPSA